MNTREIRARASLERRALSDSEKAAGYIGALTGGIPFNSDSKMMTKRDRPRPFVERLAPDVFKRSLTEDKDIMVNAGHTEDPQAALARIGENLHVTTDSRGLNFEALLPDTKAAADILTLVDKRIIRGTSFEFQVRDAGETWEKRDDRTDLRTITDARLHSFNPVIWPAYDDTSLTVEIRRQEHVEQVEGRGTYSMPGGAGIVDYYDPTVTADTKFAAACLSRATYALTDSLEYLRGMPEGGMAEMARMEVSVSADTVKKCVDFLAANGAQVNPAAMKRARELESEARAAVRAPLPLQRDHYFPGLRIVAPVATA